MKLLACLDTQTEIQKDHDSSNQISDIFNFCELTKLCIALNDDIFYQYLFKTYDILGITMDGLNEKFSLSTFSKFMF